MALEQVANRVKGRIFYIQAGQFIDSDTEKSFIDAARNFAPSVRHIFIDGRNTKTMQEIWHAADIFFSLSDNIQETFGLTPIEAMAAGLPVVVTDWNGYRDTVRDGVDGFRIPTRMPSPGDHEDIARAFAAETLAYKRYCGITSQFVSFDYRSCITALEQLMNNPALGRRMGQSGRQRVIDLFDWKHVIRQYQDLFQELAEIRAVAQTIAPRHPLQPAYPLRADPFLVFGSYPTAFLESNTPLYPGAGANVDLLKKLSEHPLNHFSRQWRGDTGLLNKLLQEVSDTPGITVQALGGRLTDYGKLTVLRGVAWMLKMGLIMTHP